MFVWKLYKALDKPFITAYILIMWLILLYLVLPATDRGGSSSVRFLMSYVLLRNGMNPAEVEVYMSKYYSTAGGRMQSELSNESWR